VTTSPEWARALAGYNRWMNERLYEVCAGLPDAERRRDAGAFFGSIHGTLNHLLLADLIWLGRFEGEPYTGFETLADELHADFEALRRARAATDDRIDAFAARLDAAALAAELEFTSFVTPRERSFPLWVLVTHFFNHQTHHRGQLTTLLSQGGHDPGVTDLMWLPGLETT